MKIFSPKVARVVGAIAGFCGALFFAGCAATGEPPPPLVRAALTQARAGESAYLMGKPAAAVAPLNEAVRLRVAAGDLPAAALGCVNLALAQRAAGDAAGAAATASRLRALAPSAQQQARERLGAGDASAAEIAAGLAWLDALLALDGGDAAAAANSLAATDPKLRTSSPWPGRIATLRAEIALAQSRSADALAHALAGQKACATARDRAEEARAHRLAGAARVRLAQWREAQTSFLAAIKLEESLGAGRRIVGDLEQLAEVSRRLGDNAAAERYAGRAREIAAAL